MARFDVYQGVGEPGYLLDCQADLLSELNTRFIVPLLPPDHAPRAGERLNPSFEIDGETVVMVTQFAGSIPVHELGPAKASLDHKHATIMNALDMLLTGY